MPDAVDITGRPGVGVRHDGGLHQTTLILDGNNCEVLGFETVLTGEMSLPQELQDAPDLQPGSGMAEAILERGVVDSVDERP